MNTSTLIYIIIILAALVAIFFINKDFFMGLIKKSSQKMSAPQYNEAQPVTPQPVAAQPQPVAPQPAEVQPAPAPVATPAPAPTPAAAPTSVDETWTCSCGTVNTRKFCAECGEKRPEKKEIKCPACGYKPEEGERIPKFCPECGAKME